MVSLFFLIIILIFLTIHFNSALHGTKVFGDIESAVTTYGIPAWQLVKHGDHRNIEINYDPDCEICKR